MAANRLSLPSASFLLFWDSGLRIADISRPRSVPYGVLAEVQLFQSFLLSSTNIGVRVTYLENGYKSNDNFRKAQR